MDLSNESRELVAVAVTAAGRRVPVRYRDLGPSAGDPSRSDLLRLGLVGLVGLLITGSRREPGGRRGKSR